MRVIRNWGLFLLLYGGVNFLIIPQIAKQYGKVPMPVFHQDLKPHNLSFALFNRHYVTPNMRATMLTTAKQMKAKYPNTILYYLDASHPLGKYRLYPHLKHHNGKKLDVCYYYKNKQGKTVPNPVTAGYGYFVKVKAGETNYPKKCSEQGSWWYSATGTLVRGNNTSEIEVDVEKNAYFLNLLTRNSNLRRVFVEPHLKERFGLQQNNKVRFHGCWAVRHDDHAHLEIR